jgi:hypothetical protein
MGSFMWSEIGAALGTALGWIFDLATAGGNLIGLSNALSPLETTYDDRVPHINKIQIALRLPRTYTDDDVKQARERKLNSNSIRAAQQIDDQRRNTLTEAWYLMPAHFVLMIREQIRWRLAKESRSQHLAWVCHS